MSPGCAPSRRVYPRVCGVTAATLAAFSDSRGLSPRVRGHRSGAKSTVSAGRSIPACAGSPGIGHPTPTESTVYPRVCGVTFWITSRRDVSEGLSPRVRGHPCWLASRSSSRGSIPACAGSPTQKQTPKQTIWVYPRVCGVTAWVYFTAYDMRGLSPRVRGHPAGQHPARLCLWSIPACAGSPMPKSAAIAKARVYPRVCGVTGDRFGSGLLQHGLSPRVRGHRNKCVRRTKRCRSIPACAGSPLRSRRCGCLGPVYPRVCGVTPLSKWQRSGGSTG
mgnify:CR=1 FL=1